LTWARLTLNLKPFEPVSDGTGGVVHASRWVETDPRAVAIVRASGDEDDYARSLQPFDRRTREETRALLARARTWDRPAAITRALILGGADWLYYHGGFREAVQTFGELLAAAERYGSIVGQAEALVRLTVARIALGEMDAAKRTAARAKAMVERLGPSHHLRVSEAWLAALLAEYLDGDWPTIAADWTRFAADPQAADWTIVIDEAALAALAHARAGAPVEAKRLLAALTPILSDMDPTHWLVNGAVGLAASAVWSLGATELAPAYRRLAHGLVTAGVGDYPLTCNELSAARMSALLGEMDDAEASFARARRALDASGQRPLRAIVDYDEALALVRRGAADRTRPTALFHAALVEFRALAMDGWARRALAALEGMAQTEQRADAEQTWPAGLTDREVDVLRLVVRGYSDRQVGDALFISPRTVHAHVRHMLAKTTLTNRTELSVWAVEHGLVGETSDV
jgi:DNA-binding CsgD family transcriptional regulator